MGERVMLSIRPELIRIAPAGGRDSRRGSIAWPGGVVAGSGVAPQGSVNRLTGTIVEDTFFGQSSEHLVAVGSGRLTVVSAPPQFGVTGAAALEFSPSDVVVLSR